jgi:hypothetical protein
VRWEILDRLAAAANGGGEKAEVAASVRGQLDSAASHDEHQVQLRGALDQAERAAIDLLLQPPPPPAGVPGPDRAAVRPPSGSPPPPPAENGPGRFARRVTAREVAAVVEELRETADRNPGASFDISWRIVTE